MTMPKQKTHKGTAKRFRRTGSGKLVRRQSGRGHLRLAKGKDSYRRLSGRTDVAKADEARIDKLLGGK
jgi:large subunit ribosomal protein L35